MEKTKKEGTEVDIFLEAIFQKYGYDFRNYAKASIKRRIQNLQKKFAIRKISDMIPRMHQDRSFSNSILAEFSITVTEMFRDPEFYRSIRENIVPYLDTYPFIKIWHAGCATGEEAYSLAIILKEENLYHKTTIFATDFNNVALRKARNGIYSLDEIKEFTQSYQKAGGKRSFSDYYHAKYKSAIIDNSLKKNITFANHNLVTDSDFGEMHLILCRNVLIYFNKILRDRVLNLFDSSLIHKGFLAIGSKESLNFSSIEKKFNPVDKKNKIYRKK